MADAVPARLTAAEGRKFGLTVGLAFVALAALLAWRGYARTAAALGLLGAALSLSGLLIPRHLGPVQRVWMAFAVAISMVTTPIFMGLVYFLVLTPTGILRRTLGGDPLVPSARDSSWSTRRHENRSDLRRQF